MLIIREAKTLTLWRGFFGLDPKKLILAACKFWVHERRSSSDCLAGDFGQQANTFLAREGM